MQEQVEQEVNSIETSLETALKQLWEKAYTAANAIGSLREEKTVLQLRVDELEALLSQAQADASRKSSEISRLKEELEKAAMVSSSNGLLDKEERVKMQERVKEILEKINAHL